MTPTFSIIIPHKEIPDLLMRCLKSIPVSEDIQVIVVDDNSAETDTYLERYPELSRPYLEFIRTTKDGGAGYARNVGLDCAKGEWILFADADDFFVEDVNDIICSYADSEADVIYFRSKSVHSENINIRADKCTRETNIIDQYLIDGDEWPVRAQIYGQWGKMIKRSLFVKNNIRFEETEYSNDAYCALLTGYYAAVIKVVDRALYVHTFRPHSLTGEFCTKPGELKIRAEVFFRCDKFMYKNGFCRERRTKFYLLKMLKQDRGLFKDFFFRLDEIYPSKLSALWDVSKDRSLMFKIIFYLYSFLVWLRVV